MPNEFEKIAQIIQKFLKPPPTIIWGSGATISYGMPTMDKLKEICKGDLPDHEKDENLETILNRVSDENKIFNIKNKIWEEVNRKDLCFLSQLLSDTTNADEIVQLIKKLTKTSCNTHSIITTNYDRVLEYVLAKMGEPFTDGFNSKTLSQFDDTLFNDKNCINLFKPHGSLNWYKHNNKTVYLPNIEKLPNSIVPEIIPPSYQKFYSTSAVPYREIISTADRRIKKSDSFLVVGFGFNDEHLTPLLIEKAENDTPIVIVTKTASEKCKQAINGFKKYILIEESSDSIKPTLIRYKDNNDETYETFSGNYWQLKHFMELW